MAGENIHGIGLGTTQESQHVDVKVFPDVGFAFPVILASTTRDAYGSPANSPTTTIRNGVVLARITSTKEFVDYLNGEADGRGTAICILDEEVDMLDDVGTAEDKLATAHIQGVYDQDLLQNIDSAGKTEMKALFSLFREDIYG